MGGFGLHSTGDLSATTKFLKHAKDANVNHVLRQYGTKGVAALRSKTPIKTGTTAASWDYTISETKDGPVLYFTNSNIQNGISVVQLLENGHAARDGSWVSGRPFVNETIDGLEKKMIDAVWKEVDG